MRPSNRPVDFKALKLARDSYLKNGNLPKGLDPVIGASWERCRPRLDPSAIFLLPFTEGETRGRSSLQRNFLRLIARPIMEDVYEYIEGSGVAVMLVDASSRALEALGDADMVELVASMGIKPGALLDEGRMGTNAFALAIIEGVPIQVVGHEHYAADLLGLYDAAAPIYDAAGRNVGAIGFLCALEQRPAHSLGAAMAAAIAIENRLLADMFVRDAEAQATEYSAVIESIADGVLVWTSGGVLTHLNARGGRLLGVDPAAAVGRPLSDAILLPAEIMEAARKGDEDDTGNDLPPGDFHGEATFVVDGRAVSVNASVHVVRDRSGEPAEYVATIRPMPPQIKDLSSPPVKPLKELERAAIAEALRAFDGRSGAAAAALGIGRNTLHRKIVEYGLDKEGT